MNPLFPLIRHLSKPLTYALIRLPLTPNHITSAALISGLWGCWFFIGFEAADRITGSLLFLLGYILDNCDGEVARHKNLKSEFGEKYDTFVDWIVHSCFFAALGFGVSQETGQDYWLWLGLAGSVGGTINYLISVFLRGDSEATQKESKPEGIKDTLVYIFRELFRADFCFIVLTLSFTDFLWLLVPAGAIGAQVYWLMFFMSRNKNYHV